FSSRRRHTRFSRDLEFRRVLFRSPHAVLGTQSTRTPTAAMPASVTRLVIQFQRLSDRCSAAAEAPTAGWNVSISHSYRSPLSSRSEERRVGKESSTRSSQYNDAQK